MARSKVTTWVLGTAFLAVLMLVAAWFFAISPRMESAAELRSQAQSEQAHADQLRIQLAGLKADAENIEAFRQELAALRTQLPAAAELANLTRQINDLSLQSGLFISGLVPGVPAAVVPPVAPAPPAAETPEATDEAAGEDSETTDEPAVPVADPLVAATQGLYSIPLQITVVGGYPQTLDFINRLQTANPRLVLVTTFVATAQEAAAAEGGRPAVNPGDLETVISCFVYALVDPAVPTTPVADTEQPPLPVPAADSNPFAASGG